ncbi:putative gustatory receptor 28b [Eupeodes corollae]|uniref:putative gustatory receptor 28b n=1 Tax=Eupeodes corollae TaxID=290404 RepID=UPI00248FD105|nr:putative gustatory receptor 28b [Eupeodes corollae]
MFQNACVVVHYNIARAYTKYNIVFTYSAKMSFELFTQFKFPLESILGRFSDNNIWFVVHPFFKIFKYTGFCPVRVSTDSYPDVSFQWDRLFVVLTGLCFIGFTAGFCRGVHVLSHLDSLGLHDANTIISYITNWAQVFSLFFLACVSLVTSWTNLEKLRNFFMKIRQIDFALEMTGVEISYRAMRRRLFIQTGVSFLIPTCLSMVNCIMINTTFRITSPCYWFICFTPMLLLTLKELQFYNIMFLLKGKFAKINKQIEKLCQRKIMQNETLTMTINANIMTKCSDEKELLGQTDAQLVEQMRFLAEIYSDVADCVDEVLEIFAYHLLMTTCISFAVITIQSYNLFALIMHSLAMQLHEICFTMAWIVVQIMVIGVNVIACTQTSTAMADTGIFLHKLKPRDDYGLFLQMVQVFSMEVMHRKKPFTAAGFFEMNFKLFTSIVAAVTTYLIIIIQFHLANLEMNSSNKSQENL